MKKVEEVIRDIAEHLKGIPLNSISGRAAPFSVYEVDFTKRNYLIQLSEGTIKSRPLDEIERIWKEMLIKAAVHVESLLGGSGSSRNQPETILANLPYVEWLPFNGKKHIAYVRENTHEYGTLKQMSNDTMYEYTSAFASNHSKNLLPSNDKLLVDIAFNYSTNIECDLPRNRIVFGAPGTGKSFLIKRELETLLNEFNVGDDNYERVTFHPDYSYANFVGTYKPVMENYGSAQTLDEETKTNLEILNDPNKSAQEKYDFFYDNEKDIGLTRIPILIGIATDEPFHTKKSAGDDAANDNNVERNHGIALRKYVRLKGENSDIKSSEISYKYVPGPFMRIYVKALENAQKAAKGEEEPRPFLLIIEEINRANVAAVFGEVFQLLDRKNNVSEYPIQASEDIKQYLAERLGGNLKDYAKIRIPDNMFIWATMNSADQGVFPMDTAFKRRWDFTYLGIDDNDEELKDKFVSMIHHGERKFVEWNSLRMAINEFLANEKINEDKQLGPYFIARDVVVPASGNEIDKDKFNDVFKHKVLMYLFDDAAKQKRSKLFEGISAESSRYSKICKAFDEKGVDIFHTSIRDTVITRGYLHEAKEPEPLNETEDWKESDA